MMLTPLSADSTHNLFGTWNHGRPQTRNPDKENRDNNSGASIALSLIAKNIFGHRRREYHGATNRTTGGIAFETGNL